MEDKEECCEGCGPLQLYQAYLKKFAESDEVAQDNCLSMCFDAPLAEKYDGVVDDYSSVLADAVVGLSQIEVEEMNVDLVAEGRYCSQPVYGAFFGG